MDIIFDYLIMLNHCIRHLMMHFRYKLCTVFGFRYNDTAGNLITVMSFERHGISNHKQLDCFSSSLTCWTTEQITCVLISSHNYVFNSTQFNGIWNGRKCKTLGKYCCFQICDDMDMVGWANNLLKRCRAIYPWSNLSRPFGHWRFHAISNHQASL